MDLHETLPKMLKQVQSHSTLAGDGTLAFVPLRRDLCAQGLLGHNEAVDLLHFRWRGENKLKHVEEDNSGLVRKVHQLEGDLEKSWEREKYLTRLDLPQS